MSQFEKLRIHRRTLLISIGCIIVIVVLIGWLIRRPVEAVQPSIAFKTVTSPAQSTKLSWPAYGQSAIGAVGYGILETKGDQIAVPTASLAKVMTALAVLRERPLSSGESGPTITLTQDDVDIYNRYVAQDGSVVRVAAGEQITQYQALQALLLPSANNIADSLAIWAFGSVKAYTEFATNYAQKMGMTSFTVTDPSGLAATTSASARDMAILAQLALQNSVIKEIIAQPSAAIPVQGTITNYNFLLGDDGNIGIKTGNNDQNLGAFMFAVNKDIDGSPMTFYGAVMNGPSLTAAVRDSAKLANSMAANFTKKRVVSAGDTIGNYRSADGTAIRAVANDDLDALTWNGSSYLTSASLRPLQQDVKSGSEVGTIGAINVQTRAINSVPVTLQSDFTMPNQLAQLRQRLK